MKQLDKFYKNKKVFVTGHTGFKGSWLTSCLLNFGAIVTGFSKKDEKLINYKKICYHEKVNNIYSDILDYKFLCFIFQLYNSTILSSMSLIVL